MIPAMLLAAFTAVITGRWLEPRKPFPEQWRAGLAFVTREVFLFTVAGLIVLGVWYLV